MGIKSVAASVLGEMAIEKTANLATGKRVATQDLSYIDKDGNAQTKTKGQEFNINDVSETDKNNIRKNSNVKSTIPTKMASGMWNELKSGAKKVSDLALESMGAERLNNSTDNPTDGSQQQNKPHTNDEVGNKPKQNTPPNSDSKSVPKEAEKSKKMSISEQIDAQGKYDKEVNTLKNQFAEQNKLNGGGTSEMLEKQAQKLESLEKA